MDEVDNSQITVLLTDRAYITWGGELTNDITHSNNTFGYSGNRYYIARESISPNTVIADGDRWEEIGYYDDSGGSSFLTNACNSRSVAIAADRIVTIVNDAGDIAEAQLDSNRVFYPAYITSDSFEATVGFNGTVAWTKLATIDIGQVIDLVNDDRNLYLNENYEITTSVSSLSRWIGYIKNHIVDSTYQCYINLISGDLARPFGAGGLAIIGAEIVNGGTLNDPGTTFTHTVNYTPVSDSSTIMVKVTFNYRVETSAAFAPITATLTMDGTSVLTSTNNDTTGVVTILHTTSNNPSGTAIAFVFTVTVTGNTFDDTSGATELVGVIEELL